MTDCKLRSAHGKHGHPVDHIDHSTRGAHALCCIALEPPGETVSKSMSKVAIVPARRRKSWSSRTSRGRAHRAGPSWCRSGWSMSACTRRRSRGTTPSGSSHQSSAVGIGRPPSGSPSGWRWGFRWAWPCEEYRQKQQTKTTNKNNSKTKAADVQ